jgi:hypothetical protein
VADVLAVSAGELSDPVPFLVLMETSDPSIHRSSLGDRPRDL